MNKDNYFIEDLDDSWILEFEKIDDEYKYFYKENITFIRIRCIYIDKNQNITRIKTQKLILNEPNYLSKEEIMSFIQRNGSKADGKYSLLSILKYHINLEPSDLTTFLKSKINQSFLSTVSNIDTIYFSPSIYSFQDLNEILFIFYEKLDKSGTNGFTKKVIIKSYPKNKTARKNVYISSNKQYD